VAFQALIVDDSSAVRAFVRASLEDADFARVQEAETGFEALRLLAANAFKSPRQQGARKILISTQVDGPDSERGTELGADAFLKKPFEVDELRALIRGLLGSVEEVSR